MLISENFILGMTWKIQDFVIFKPGVCHPSYLKEVAFVQNVDCVCVRPQAIKNHSYQMKVEWLIEQVLLLFSFLI